jgi:predicted GNAT family N-acyltransferase
MWKSRKNPGWYRESYRHSLASRGIKTTNNTKIHTQNNINQSNITYNTKELSHIIIIKAYDGRNEVGSVNIQKNMTPDVLYSSEIKNPHLKIGMISVNNTHQGEGIGRSLMNQAIEIQEDINLPMYLIPSPPEPDPNFAMNKQRLIDFYKSYGFQPTHDEHMVRYPGVAQI